MAISLPSDFEAYNTEALPQRIVPWKPEMNIRRSITAVKNIT
jgi:hypothetical protein